MLESDEARFLKKILVRPKCAENGPKMTKNRVFRNFLKIRSLDFSDFLHDVRGHGGS